MSTSRGVGDYKPSWLYALWGALTVWNCGGCSACCYNLRCPPWTNEEIEHPPMPQSLWWPLWKRIIEVGREHPPATPPCIALKGGLCSIHSVKPKLCSDAPVGGSICLGARKRRGVRFYWSLPYQIGWALWRR